MAQPNANFEEILTPIRIRRRSRRGETRSPAAGVGLMSPLVADAYEQGRRSALWEASCRTRLQSLSKEWQVVKNTPTKRERRQEDKTDGKKPHLTAKRRKMASQGISGNQRITRAMLGKVNQEGGKKDNEILREKNVNSSYANFKREATSVTTPPNTMIVTPRRVACRTPAGKENACSTQPREGPNPGRNTPYVCKNLAERRKAAEEKFIARQKAAKQRSCQKKR